MMPEQGLELQIRPRSIACALGGRIAWLPTSIACQPFDMTGQPSRGYMFFVLALVPFLLRING